MVSFAPRRVKAWEGLWRKGAGKYFKKTKAKLFLGTTWDQMFSLKNSTTVSKFAILSHQCFRHRIASPGWPKTREYQEMWMPKKTCELWYYDCKKRRSLSLSVAIWSNSARHADLAIPTVPTVLYPLKPCTAPSRAEPKENPVFIASGTC